MLNTLKRTAIVAAMLTSALISQQALAHAHLLTSVPASQAAVAASPDHLTLTFSEDLEAAFSGAQVTSTDGKSVNTGKATTDSNNKKVLNVPLSAPLAAGNYLVAWHALSVDGHKTKGSYSFSVQ